MLKLLKLILDWSEVWAPLVPLVCLLFRNRQPRILRPVIVYLLFAFFINVAADIIGDFKSHLPVWLHSNNVLYNVHSVIRFICFSYFFISLKQNYFSRIRYILVNFLLLLIIINFKYFENFGNPNHLSGNLLSAEAYILLVYCMLYYLSKLRDEVDDISSGPDFWIVTGLSIYVVISFFVFLFYVPMIDEDPALADNMWDVHNTAYILLCLFITKAIMNLLAVSLQYRVIIGISAMVILFVSFIIAFIANQRKKLQYHKNLQAIHEEQQRALVQQNLQLEDRVKERTSELLNQKESLQSALSDLRASQLQLVQKEKMASLGEVAAGIAHEIQNPLNFINNFAEISSELLEEIKELLATVSTHNAPNEEVKKLIEETIGNMHKINHHGKRADNIVKSMLQHSAKSSGTMELTDINLLAGEFLKLSYLSIHSKDNLFNASVETNFDQRLEKINIIPQDIGRVLMNIYNNAFYSTSEKLKKNKTGFNPVISVITKQEAGKAIIQIRDNGLGVPKKYLDKIYQPFFTTKPAGEGTGLGLSLSYDIITAHRGELKVDSAEGEYAEFIIELPVR